MWQTVELWGNSIAWGHTRGSPSSSYPIHSVLEEEVVNLYTRAVSPHKPGQAITGKWNVVILQIGKQSPWETKLALLPLRWALDKPFSFPKENNK